MDEVASLDWDIVPEEEYEYDWVEDGIKEIKHFLKHPNHNDEPFQNVIRALIKDILEIDAGVLVKVYTTGSYDFENIEPKSGAPLLKEKGQRKMVELYARDGSSFLKEIDKFGFVRGYWQYSYQIPAHPMWFDKEEIIYISEHTRSMSCYGYARTQGVLDIIKSLHYATLYNKRFFEETTIPDGALSLLDTNEVEMKAFLDWWNGEFKAQPHKMAVINKDIKWQPFSTTNKELEFLETQKWYYRMVIGMFGLTPAEMGITDDLNKATAATQAELSKRKGIRPFLRIIEDAINTGIIPEFNIEGVKFQFIYDDPGEKNSKLVNWKMELDMGIKTINEVRNEIGLAPVPNGDVSNTFQQMQMGPSQSQGQSQNPFNPKESKEEEDTESQEGNYKEEAERQEGRTKGLSDVKAQKGKYETMPLKELISEHKRLVDILESGDEEDIKQEADKQRKELEEYISKLNKALSGQYYNEPQEVIKPHHGMITQPSADSSQTLQSRQGPEEALVNNLAEVQCPVCGQNTLNILQAEDTNLQDIRCIQCGSRFMIQELLDKIALQDMGQMITANNSVEPISLPKHSWTKGCDCHKGYIEKGDAEMSVKDYVGFDISKSYTDAMAFANSKEYKKLLKDYLEDLSAKEIDKIIKIIKNSLLSGASIKRIAAKIEPIVKDYKRADLISRTELIRVANEGNRIKAEERGFDKMMFISAPEDGRLCDKCKKLDRKVFSTKEMQGMIPIHPRCRCTSTEFIE